MAIVAQNARKWMPGLAGLLVLVVMLQLPRPVEALILGGTGNAPIHDPGWPVGAAAVFNSKARVAYWEGPPFGGGEWHAEFRGDAEALNRVLADFAQIEAEGLQVVVRDGVGHSFWLNPNNEPEKEEGARIDWVFVVWQPESWQRLQKLPPAFRQTDTDQLPPPRIEVYVGGNVRWGAVQVPDGIEIVDERLEAHGFQLSDGTVLEGTVLDFESSAPLSATVHLERIDREEEGGYRYTRVANATCDADGHWVMKSAPEGSHRIVVEAEGYVPRVVAHKGIDGGPRWEFLPTVLVRGGGVSGHVIDENGAGLGGTRVRLDYVVVGRHEVYRTAEVLQVLTAADGTFQLDNVPRGHTVVRAGRPGFAGPGLGVPIRVPAKDVKVTLLRAASVHVVVEFGDKPRPEGYLVEMTPEGGNAVGKWSGTALLDAGNSARFENVPPGRYIVYGRPNPGSELEQTEAVRLDLRGGDTRQVTLQAP